ncbi:hypothetical protein HDU81_000174, partial [Chytriomyces hyalinus]
KVSESESTLLEFEGIEKWLLEEITGKDEEIRQLNEQVLRLSNKVASLEKQIGNKDRTITKLQNYADTTQSKLETMLAEREKLLLADAQLKKTQETESKLLQTRITAMEKEAIQKQEKLDLLEYQVRELEDCLKRANQENETPKQPTQKFEINDLDATTHVKTDLSQDLNLQSLEDRLESVMSALESDLEAAQAPPTVFETLPPSATDEAHRIYAELTLKSCDGTVTRAMDGRENDTFSGELQSLEQKMSSVTYELRELRTASHAASGHDTRRYSPETQSDCSESSEARICESLQNADNEMKDSFENYRAEFSVQAQAFTDLMAAAVEIVSALRVNVECQSLGALTELAHEQEAEPLIVSAIGQLAERHDRVADDLELALSSPPGPAEQQTISSTVPEMEKITIDEMVAYCNQLKAAIEAITSADSRSRVINEENLRKLVETEQANSELQNNFSTLQQQYSNECARNANAPSVHEVATFQKRLSEVEQRLADSLDGPQLAKRAQGLELILQQLQAKSGLESQQTTDLIDRIRELETAIYAKLDGLNQLEHEWSRYLASPMENSHSDSLPGASSRDSNSTLSKLHVLEAEGETLFVRE